MDLIGDPNMHKRLHSGKDRLLKQVRNALEEAGLHDYEIKSISLFLKRTPLRCPVGQEPVWEPVTKPDGTVVYEWVCK
jgi:hypothetical protein